VKEFKVDKPEKKDDFKKEAEDSIYPDEPFEI
jgi:hypothetical protein